MDSRNYPCQLLYASIGLVLGGVIADLFSWRICFYINGPIGILLILTARHFLEETEKYSGQFDLVGAVSSTLLGSTILLLLDFILVYFLVIKKRKNKINLN